MNEPLTSVPPADDWLDAALRADADKSRFLAIASHDLRQPLQTLRLLNGALEEAAEERERLVDVAVGQDERGAEAHRAVS